MLTEEEILKFINNDKTSKKKQLAKIGERYYESEHDILDYRMFYYNQDGVLVEDTTRANVKKCHGFFGELVDQEVQYILSGKDGLVHSDDTKLQKELNKYFNRKFKNALSEVITGAITKGFEYMYAYVNKKGRLTFERADSLGVIEVRERETDDGCAYVIYWYIDKLTKDDKAIKRIQVWDENQTYYYVQEENGRLLLDDSERINPRPHVIYTKDGDDAIYYENFGYIPFFRLDNNKKQHSGVKTIKSLIDDYDMMACGLSNNLADFDHPTYVVKGFDGNDFEELQTNLKTKKMIGTPEGGGLEVHTIEVPYQARIANMDKDEENIYRFGMGFNSAQVGDGNVTNVVIKSRYALLDLKCNKLQARLEEFLDNILEVVLKEINKNNKTNYDIDDVYYSFEKEIITNELDNAQIELLKAQKRQAEINTILSLAEEIDNVTIVKLICEQMDIDYEEIKDKLPKPKEAYEQVDDVTDTLNKTVPDE
nr:MAG TPA: PORTAL PROTEIN [Caudoviricetes sp.]